MKVLIIGSVILLILIIFINNSDPYCSMVKDVCNGLLNIPIIDTEGCNLLAGQIDAVCELVGGGPEDPLSDACAATASGSIPNACSLAINHVGGFGVDKCISALKC